MSELDKRSLYRLLCMSEVSIPLFQQAWWLDATGGEEGWDVAIVERGGEVHAAMPYVAQKRLGFTIISQPELTQFLGPWTRDTGAKLTNN